MSFLDKIFGKKEKKNTISKKDQDNMTDKELYDEIIRLKESDEFKNNNTKDRIINDIIDLVHKINDESIIIELEKINFEEDNQLEIHSNIIHRITDENVLSQLILENGASFESIRQISDTKILNYLADNIKEKSTVEFLRNNARIRMHDKNRTITSSEAQYELKILNDNFRGNACIKRAIDMKESVNNWPDDMKAFYYYIIADAIKYKSRFDKRQYAFFAAQVYYNPANTSLGWMELIKIEKNISPNAQNAQLLHNKYPLPDSFQELL